MNLGSKTKDIGGNMSTTDFTKAVVCSEAVCTLNDF